MPSEVTIDLWEVRAIAEKWLASQYPYGEPKVVTIYRNEYGKNPDKVLVTYRVRPNDHAVRGIVIGADGYSTTSGLRRVLWRNGGDMPTIRHHTDLFDEGRVTISDADWKGGY